jgi:hypothetical protein
METKCFSETLDDFQRTTRSYYDILLRKSNRTACFTVPQWLGNEYIRGVMAEADMSFSHVSGKLKK